MGHTLFDARPWNFAAVTSKKSASHALSLLTAPRRTWASKRLRASWWLTTFENSST